MIFVFLISYCVFPQVLYFKWIIPFDNTIEIRKSLKILIEKESFSSHNQIESQNGHYFGNLVHEIPASNVQNSMHVCLLVQPRPFTDANFRSRTLSDTNRQLNNLQYAQNGHVESIMGK